MQSGPFPHSATTVTPPCRESRRLDAVPTWRGHGERRKLKRLGDSTRPCLDRCMIAADDSWYIRYPDGRVIRAANTTVVRHNIQHHNIPFGCMVRRAGDE